MGGREYDSPIFISSGQEQSTRKPLSEQAPTTFWGTGPTIGQKDVVSMNNQKAGVRSKRFHNRTVDSQSHKSAGPHMQSRSFPERYPHIYDKSSTTLSDYSPSKVSRRCSASSPPNQNSDRISPAPNNSAR